MNQILSNLSEHLAAENNKPKNEIPRPISVPEEYPNPVELNEMITAMPKNIIAMPNKILFIFNRLTRILFFKIIKV